MSQPKGARILAPRLNSPHAQKTLQSGLKSPDGLSDKLIGAISSSLTQCAPECSTCVFESHCGADPVYHHATQGDTLGIKPLSGFCARQKGIMGLLLDILDNSPADAGILRRWATA